METEKRHLSVEELFRQKLENAEISPGEAVNAALMRKLARREFLRFNPARFNIYYLGLIAAGVITAGVLMLANVGSHDNNHQESIRDREETQEVFLIPDSTPVRQNKTEEQPKTSPAIKNTEVIAGKQETIQDQSREFVRERNIIMPAFVGESSKEILVNEKSRTDRLQASSAGNNALFTPSVVSGCAPLKVHFSNMADSYLEYKWNFGDGGVSYEREPIWIYDVDGEYMVTMKVTDKTGKTSSWSVTIRVYPRPKANFEITPDKAVLPIDEIRFSNFSTGATSYRWSFGDGETSTDYQPVHKYVKYGKYDVSLVAFSENGCSDTLVIRNAFSGSDYSISMPNAFVPNPQGPSSGFYSAKSDELAEIFHPVSSGVSEFQLRIFSKTGVLLFESNDINIGWDGYFKGQLCNPGVYIWKVRGNFSNGEPFTKMGDVILLKRQNGY